MRLAAQIYLAAAMWMASWATAAAEKPVWLVSNGFHTSVALRWQEAAFAHKLLPRGQWDFILIGWGAADFYRGKADPWTLLRALWPGPSIVHLVPVRGPLELRFPHSEIVHLELAPAGMEALQTSLEKSVAKGPAQGQPILLGQGYFRESRFYAGGEQFYFPNMCNLWVAAKLRRSGVSLNPAGAITASGLLKQAARKGEVWQRLSRPKDGF